jgi:hypothetical protein
MHRSAAEPEPDRAKNKKTGKEILSDSFAC